MVLVREDPDLVSTLKLSFPPNVETQANVGGIVSASSDSRSLLGRRKPGIPPPSHLGNLMQRPRLSALKGRMAAESGPEGQMARAARA